MARFRKEAGHLRYEGSTAVLWLF
ncbi:hypothetical protein XHV734_0302 [Xanthomonas hortorum pv. vitians]|nr:hypothetical protein XHV734_0302 [Xanthomonas hortorum pv. vitians]